LFGIRTWKFIKKLLRRRCGFLSLVSREDRIGRGQRGPEILQTAARAENKDRRQRKQNERQHDDDQRRDAELELRAGFARRTGAAMTLRQIVFSVFSARASSRLPVSVSDFFSSEP